MMGIFLLLFKRANKIYSEILENKTNINTEYLPNLQLLTKRTITFTLNVSINDCRGITYFSSFIAICKGSVSPSSSTITGAHMLLKQSEHNQAEECWYENIRVKFENDKSCHQWIKWKGNSFFTEKYFNLLAHPLLTLSTVLHCSCISSILPSFRKIHLNGPQHTSSLNICSVS